MEESYGLGEGYTEQRCWRPAPCIRLSWILLILPQNSCYRIMMSAFAILGLIVYAEIQHIFWILQGREAIHCIHHICKECRRWKARLPEPKKADLPAACLCLLKLPSHPIWVYCFGPFQTRLGCGSEKRWGIIFKCLCYAVCWILCVPEDNML